MPDDKLSAPIEAASVPPRAPLMAFPEPLASLMAGRERRALGDAFGLTRFGVNLTRMKPGSISAARHSHSLQDEFLYVLEGTPLLITNGGETLLHPGMCVGFRAGTDDAHHLVNKTGTDVLYLEVGDRTTGDAVFYPDDDIALDRTGDGRWKIVHKDGSSY
ncbi:cupin domain-containing protein [Telmatospirillum sp.]|uniref:cupin domain-containing protein n=1 Tax=Telmatospirillum sp. TaxID=2079197 RepID=UPI00284EC5C1|nr:cupin domain-containing protein [Telmatospirillum sp.]MDR3437831.1 cupin domain-containing protein [Telmatospirillum sp.]